MRTTPPEAELRLWSVLRDRRLAAHKFKRQQVIGNYIVDFVNFELRLIIEADGSQHVDNAADERRTVWLESQGFRMIRFWNDDILARTELVTDAIWSALSKVDPPLPNPSPARGEGLRSGALHA